MENRLFDRLQEIRRNFKQRRANFGGHRQVRDFANLPTTFPNMTVS
jgi:hypothetical protein